MRSQCGSAHHLGQYQGDVQVALPLYRSPKLSSPQALLTDHIVAKIVPSGLPARTTAAPEPGPIFAC
jgi:hypothetical protein